jgi:ABC-2 type transport system permease protein
MQHHPLIQLLLMHYREFVREPVALFWTFVFPIALSGIIGLGFSSDQEPVYSVAVMPQTPPRLHAVLNQLAYKTMPVKYEEEGLLLLRKGVAVLLISSPPATDSLVFHYDQHNTNAQNAYLHITNSLLRLATTEQKMRTNQLTTQGNRYIDFLIPGLLAMGLMNSALWGMGWSLVDMRIKKLLRRIVATPLPRYLFLLSHFIMRYVFATLEVLALCGFAFFMFDIRITGSYWAFVLLASAGLWAFSGISILIASRTANSNVANGLINAVYLPMSLVSGVFFNYHGFPDWIVGIIEKLPLTLLADGLREIFNEGATVEQVLMKILILLAIGTLSFLVGLRIYKWY